MKKILAFIGYWSGLEDLFYWLNRRAKRVITFHNVLPDELYNASKQTGYTDRLSDLSMIVRELGKHFTFDVDPDVEGTCTLTFDDGYLNEYEVAGKWLMGRKIPAMLFVAGKIINKDETQLPDVEKRLMAHDGIDIDTAPAEWKRLRLAGVTDAQISDLREHGWVVGWHSWSHEPISQMNLEDQKKELASPPEYRKVPMSYPFGMCTAVSQDTIRLAEEAGYPCAYSNDPWESPMRGNFYRMRYPAVSNKYELHFLVSGLKYFIQHHKLLPRF